MQAREQGGGFEGAKDRVLAKRKGKDQKKFRGWGKQRPKEVLLDVLSMGGLIDQMGLRIHISKSYQESQLNLQPGALVIPNNFHLFPNKRGRNSESANPKKPGIGKDKSHGESAVLEKEKKTPRISNM